MIKIQSIIPAMEISAEYERMFILYCQMKSSSNLELQLMLISKPLNAWFKQQYRNNLMKFENTILNSRLPIKIATAKQLYRSIAYSFFDKFNKKIIYDIRKEANRIEVRHSRDTEKDRSNQIYLN